MSVAVAPPPAVAAELDAESRRYLAYHSLRYEFLLRYVARAIGAHLRGESVEPFVYHDRGTMATIGRNAAVVHVRGLQVSGFFAWVAWLVLHIVLLIGFRNRLLVLINWAWDYFLYDRAVRLIYAHEIHTAPAETRRAQHDAAEAERRAG